MLARTWVLFVVLGILAISGCGIDGAAERERPSRAAATPESDPAPALTEDERAAAQDFIEKEEQAQAEAQRASAKEFVRNYYRDLDLRQFDAAWQRLSGGARTGMGSYEEWQAGYKNTLSSEVSDLRAETSESGSGTVSLTLRAKDVDACGETVRRRFAVTWSVARAGDRWKATGITARKVAGHEPATEFAECEDSEPSKSYADDLEDESYEDEPSYPELSGDEDPCITSCDGPEPVGNGYPVVCADGEISHSGGRSGACSHHGGVAGGSSSSSAPRLPSTSSSSGSSGIVQVDGYTRKDGTYVKPHTRRAPRR